MCCGLNCSPLALLLLPRPRYLGLLKPRVAVRQTRALLPRRQSFIETLACGGSQISRHRQA